MYSLYLITFAMMSTVRGTLPNCLYVVDCCDFIWTPSTNLQKDMFSFSHTSFFSILTLSLSGSLVLVKSAPHTSDPYIHKVWSSHSNNYNQVNGVILYLYSRLLSLNNACVALFICVSDKGFKKRPQMPSIWSFKNRASCQIESKAFLKSLKHTCNVLLSWKQYFSKRLCIIKMSVVQLFLQWLDHPSSISECLSQNDFSLFVPFNTTNFVYATLDCNDPGCCQHYLLSLSCVLVILYNQPTTLDMTHWIKHD